MIPNFSDQIEALKVYMTSVLPPMTRESRVEMSILFEAFVTRMVEESYKRGQDDAVKGMLEAAANRKSGRSKCLACGKVLTDDLATSCSDACAQVIADTGEDVL